MATPIRRDLFDFDDVVWVMHCSDGPVPRDAIASMAALDFEARPWRLRWKEHFLGLPDRVRSEAARLLGAHERDITLTQTTSSGLVGLAQSYPWSDGDEILIPRGEFPSNAWPWLALQQRGVSTREVFLWEGHRSGADAWTSAPPDADVDPETRILEAIGPKTRLVAASWVRFQDGLALDVRRLAAGCRERGVDLIIDGIQGAGTLPIDLSEIAGVSAFVASGHKGLLAPQGLALLWTDEAFRQKIAPFGSWLSVDEATDFSRPSTDFDRDWRIDGQRLEQGVPNLVGCIPLAHSLALINDAGLATIRDHVRGLQVSLLDQVRDAWPSETARLEALLDAQRLGSILSFHHGDRGMDWAQARLKEAMRKAVFPSLREGYLRVAFHGWHDESDVGRVAQWLNESSVSD